MTTKTFEQRVISIIKAIPKGKVMTYGMIAREAGHVKRARFVSGIMRRYSGDLPWHRVVNSKGYISLPTFDGYQLQKTLLQSEGIVFNSKDRIDLKTYKQND